MYEPIICRTPFVRQAAREFVDRHPELARRLNHRIEKAIDLAETGMVYELAVVETTPTYVVKSQTNGSYYTVEGRGETWQVCTCPDNQKGNHCEHGLAILFALRSIELE